MVNWKKVETELPEPYHRTIAVWQSTKHPGVRFFSESYLDAALRWIPVSTDLLNYNVFEEDGQAVVSREFANDDLHVTHWDHIPELPSNP